ncbi:MAG: FtsX-like permease family protein [Planctomycetia bacterium]|nr:FtsX-like permease family protein [Planctomycetia bacterium]
MTAARPAAARWLALGRSGAGAVLLHPLRSVVTVACVVAVLLPWLAGLAIAHGLRDQARDAVRFGPDLLVEGERLGRPAPVPLEAVATIRALPGVTDVVPRVVGEIRLGRDDVSAVLLGVPLDRLPAGTTLVRGRLPAPGASHELVVGAALARRLALDVGAKLPPFYRNDAGERVSTVVGVFASDLPVWSGHLVLTSIETASTVFAQRGLASSLGVTVPRAAREDVRRAIARLPALGPDDGHGPVRARVLSREDAGALLPAQVLQREGVFTLHWLLAFAVGLPLVLVTSGAGLAERRRETALLKAVGWGTDDVLLRALAESLLLAVGAAALAVLLAAAWLGPLRAAGLGAVYLPGVEPDAVVDVPWRLAPVPVLLATGIAVVLVTVGSLLSTWRAASTPPAEVLR